MVVVKPRATITIEQKYLEWIDQQIKEKRFANRSHGFEYAVQKLMKTEGAI
jgi:Arc/MetJ-type ribon-helix-helix transcriptional regulator